LAQWSSSGTIFVSAENEIIHSFVHLLWHSLMLSVISVFVSSLTIYGHIRPISMRYLRTIGPSDYRAATMQMGQRVLVVRCC